ncbi:MAG: transporter substrate-binding domain-containing protein [Clostridia bacterium]|nr:transporter substrate-binding domain-containing protein [Clostridia bacterium]
MKKLLAVVLAVCLLCLAGCGGTTGNNKTSIADAKSLADLSGAKIAAQAGTFHEDALAQINGAVTSTYPDFTDLLVALKSGAIDGYVAEEPTAYSVCASDDTLSYLALKNNDTGFTATAADVGIAVALKTGSELRDQINAVLATITEEQKATLMQQIVDLTAGKSVDKFVLESEAPANPVGTLKVGMECAYEPFNWTDVEASYGSVAISSEGGGYANGYDVQIAQYVANKLGMKLEVYAIEWDSLIPAVQSGAVDAVIAGMSPTAEREEEVDFTNTYYESNLVIIIKK